MPMVENAPQGDTARDAIDTVFVGRIWAASAKTGQSAESRKSCKTAASDTCLVPANSGKSRDGKEGVAGSSPAEGFQEGPAYGAFFWVSVALSGRTGPRPSP